MSIFIWSAVFASAWIFTGYFSLIQLRGLSTYPAEIRLFFFASLGCAAHMLTLTVVGLIGPIGSASQWFALIAPPSLSFALAILRPESRGREALASGLGTLRDSRVPAWHAIAPALFILILWVLTVSFAVRAPGHWDDTSFHLPMAMHYLDHGIGRSIPEHLRFPLFPGAFHLLLGSGLSFGGEGLAQSLAAMPFWLVLVGLIGAIRVWTGSRIASLYSLAAVTFVFPSLSVLGFAYLDHALMLFCWAGTLAALLALRQEEHLRTWVGLAAFFLGISASIKFYGLVWAAGWFALIFMHQGLRVAGAQSFFFFLLVSSFWYIRAYLVSGDPFHPIGGPVFGHFLWNAQDLVSQAHEQATHGIPWSSFAFWRAFSMADILLLTPALVTPLFMRKSDRNLGIAYVACVGFLLFWFFSSQVARYLMPWLPLAAFLSAFCLYRFGLQSLFRRMRSVAPTLSFLWISPIAPSIVMAMSAYPVGSTWIIEAGQRAQALDTERMSRKGYDLFQGAKADLQAVQPADRAVLQLGFENGVYFFGPGRVWGDWFGPARYEQFLRCEARCVLRPPNEMLPQLTRFQATHLIVNTERFDLDWAAYQQSFDLVLKTPQGVLLRVKNAQAPAGS